MSWPRILRNGLVLGIEDFRAFWRNWRIWLLAHVMRVATSAAMWILLGRLLGSEEVVQFLLIGQIVIVGSQFSGWTVQAFTWDRMFIGTYPLLVAAPSSLVPPMVGRTLIWLLNGVATGLATLAILVPIFWPSLPLSRGVWIVPLIVLICCSSYGLAFCLGSLVNWIPRSRNIVQNTVVIVMTGICGVVVPVTFWPPWVQGVASVLPVTHGLQAVRLIVAGDPIEGIVAGALTEAAIGLAWFTAGVLTLDLTVSRARRNGTIDVL